MFPNAKFVFIHRHPLKTISSTLNAIKVILKTKNPYTTLLSKIYDNFYSNPLCRYPLRFIFSTIPECSVILLTRITAKATRYYMKNIEKVPSDDYIAITYEEFCAHPQETLENIMEKLSLPMRNTIDAESLMKPRTVTIDTAVLTLQNHIYRSMKPYFDLFQYTVE
jgi:hypothetical protein